MPAECAPPAATAPTRVSPSESTRRGRAQSTDAGWPHWPRPLQPHAHTPPARSAASAWPSEVATVATSTAPFAAPNGTRRGERTHPPEPAGGSATPSGACAAPQAKSSPQRVTASEWSSPAATQTTARWSGTARGSGRCVSSPWPSRPPPPTPHEKSVPRASAKRVWCLAAATATTPRGSAVSPRAAAAAVSAPSSSDDGGAGSFARAGRASCDPVAAGRPSGSPPAWPQV
mmetsp:Transcript_17631/g.51029  ORF Transcript_17631/g.51029 Transcript_17631/m.51029 type:complete len:231 (+) Transcript_17631:516-1208(+)